MEMTEIFVHRFRIHTADECHTWYVLIREGGSSENGCIDVMLMQPSNNDVLFVPASSDQGHDRSCRRDVGRVFLAGVRSDSPSRRRIPSCYRPGPGRGVVVELGQRGAH